VALKAINEIEEQKVQRLIMRGLFAMAQTALRAAEDAQGAAQTAKLKALAIQEELRVRIEILDEQIGDREGAEDEYAPTREDWAADQADLDRKDEHEEGVPA
jgi:hypothetical protein